MRTSRNFSGDWFKAPVARWCKMQIATGVCDCPTEMQVFTPNGSGYEAMVIVDHHGFDIGTRIIFSKDTGHHTSGWFKNPDYERCYHLSLSFRDPLKGDSVPFEDKIADQWIDAFYGPWRKYIWLESAKFPEGKQADVRHYRVFCDEHWQPIIPRGEVYSRELTEAGWLSFSEVKAKNSGDQRDSEVIE